MKKILFIVLCITAAWGLKAQDIKTVFLSAPEDIFVNADAEIKNKLITIPADSTDLAVESTFGGTIKRLALSDNFISVQTSEASSLQIKLLPLVNQTKVVCVIRTVCSKACDSNMKFYTTDWNPLDDKSLYPPLNIDWFLKNSYTETTTTDISNPLQAMDMMPMKMEMNGEDNTLKIYLDVKNYLSKEDREKIEPYLTDEPKILTWDNTRFRE